MYSTERKLLAVRDDVTAIGVDVSLKVAVPEVEPSTLDRFLVIKMLPEIKLVTKGYWSAINFGFWFPSIIKDPVLYQ